MVVPFQDTTAACTYEAVGNAMQLIGYADEALESLEHTRSVISIMEDLTYGSGCGRRSSSAIRYAVRAIKVSSILWANAFSL